jgi:DNA-binding transcriptional LysR family regulator
MKNEKFIDISSLDARFLVKLAETQSSKEASNHMGWSISKVAHRLSKVEETLEKKLFTRNRRAGKYIPTKDILNALPFLNNIVQSSELLHSEMNIKDSHVKITSSQTILEFYLGPHIKDFINLLFRNTQCMSFCIWIDI